jgi:uncharacterized membrane protein
VWLSDGDFIANLPPGVSGIAVAAILAMAWVAVQLFRRRSPEQVEPETVRQVTTPAVQAGVNGTVEAFSTLLAERDATIRRKDREIADRDALLDEAYQGGFVPRPRPQRPSPETRHE